MKAITKFCWHLSLLLVVWWDKTINCADCWIQEPRYQMLEPVWNMTAGPGHTHGASLLVLVSGQWSRHIFWSPPRPTHPAHHLSLVTPHRRVHSLDEDCICCARARYCPQRCVWRCCHSSVMSLHYRRLPRGGWVQPPRPLSLTSYASLFPGAWVKLYWLYNFTVLDSR